MLALRGKLHMPPCESAVGSMADSPVATALPGERITGRAHHWEKENRGQALVFFGGYRSLVAEDGMRLRFGEMRPLDDV